MIVRDFERPLLEKAAVLEADPRTEVVGRQLRQSVAWMREVGQRQWDAQAATGQPKASSAGGPEPVPPTPVAASSEGPPGWLTTSQVGAQLRVGPRQVVKLIGQKRLASTLRGRVHLISQAAVDDYLLRWKSG